MLFAVAGALTLLTMPVLPDGDRLVIGVLALVSFVAAGASLWLPWRRWPARASLVLGLPAVGLIGSSAAVLQPPDQVVAIMFVLLTAWIGLNHGPLATTVFAPLLVVAYAAPLVMAGRTQDALVSTVFVVGAATLVGEVIAQRVAALERTRTRSDHRARLLSAITRVAVDQARLELSTVLSSALDGMRAIGCRWAVLVQGSGRLDDLIVVRGDPPEDGVLRRVANEALAEAVAPGADGPVVRELPGGALIAIPLVGSPDGPTLGALVGGLDARPNDEELDTLLLLGLQTGRSWESALRLQHEADAARTHEAAALTDPLTGVGSRRQADRLIAGLRWGDAVAVLDLDEFKRVNDERGHLVGDRVLRDFGAFLRRELRPGDAVARYGGEEFLLVIRDIEEPSLAAAVANRLLAAWRGTSPLVTCSAGVAVHGPSRSPTDTLQAADQALYGAKRSGRDRVETAGEDHALPPA